ncbi:hypothetical protein LDENG_00004680 [Lucifuga dentata]|nr:hypothetical protein LDENG_00004680 [Lucifuga dentata]
MLYFKACVAYLLSLLSSNISSGIIPVAPRKGQRVFVGHRVREGRGPGLGTDPEKAPGPPLDGVGLCSESNGYGSDIEKGVCSKRRRGAKKPHHGLQVSRHRQRAVLSLLSNPT